MNRIAFFVVFCAAAVAMPSAAERRSDDASDGTRNSSWWNESQSRNNSSKTDRSKCGISEKNGKIRIDSKKGKGGSAAYTSVWNIDWTDSFVLEFEHELKSSRATKTTQSATSGLAMGFGTFDATTGWTDGINIVSTRTKEGRSLRASIRMAGAEVDFSSVVLPVGAHDFYLVWTSQGGSVSLDVLMDGSTTPVLSVDGIEVYFLGHEAEGMGISLFGTSTGNFKFESSFDDVTFSGDDYNDDDDSGFDDDDGIDDDDEHGGDDDDDSGDDSDDSDDD